MRCATIPQDRGTAVMTPMEPQDTMGIIDKILAWLFLPPTMYGAAGAVLKAVNSRGCSKSRMRCIVICAVNLFGGVVTSTVAAPIIVAYLPDPFHPMGFFLSGMSGMAAMEWALDLGKRFVEVWLMRRAGGAPGHDGGDE